jgi:hypothetical protein
MPDTDRITIKQAARLLGLDPMTVRAWFRDNNLHVWKRDKVELSSVALLSAEISATGAALAEWARIQEGPESTLQNED